MATTKTQKKVVKNFNRAVAAQVAELAAQPKPMLVQAQELITGDRQKDYGNKLQNFAQIAMGVQMVLATKLRPNAEITPEDVAMIMMQVKIARLTKTPDHFDSIIDVAGYAGCYNMLQNERRSGAVLAGATYDAREMEVQRDA